MQIIYRIYRKSLFLIFFLTLDLISFGAFVRLTNSGLGCPDWPGCYGKLSPQGALKEIEEATKIQPFGPVTILKAWIEMIHRYLASILGILIGVISFISFYYKRCFNHSPYFTLMLFILTCIQGAFGAWTVIYSLMPIIVSIHLLLALCVLTLITILVERESLTIVNISTAQKKLKSLMLIGVFLIFIQIFLGGWVSTNYATLSCSSFPMCQGSWFPDMNFKEGFSLIRDLGLSYSGNLISQASLVAIHWTHRNLAFLVAIYTGILFCKFLKEPDLEKPAYFALLFLLIQFITGISIIFFRSPIFLALVHSSSATGLFTSSIIIMSRLSR